ncbi:hypothetical protein [Aureimonas sp. Leaf324]|uniref:hypothetical protein n=1 Tax=Aureimonas sp. Leaf324 TaxID=1736336 RepID=UPI0006F4FBF1|nr:hypothetical protein [Aureimonas sp. Leaf324]KQQ79863.1 hypothetical protein ASF65_12660 [Aureimonas sp. Leaf324]
MTHTPCPAGHRAALMLRIGEAVLEGTGWQAVAASLAAELGPDLAIAPDGVLPAPAPQPGAIALRVEAPDVGAWTIRVPADTDAGLMASLPLGEALGLAAQITAGRAPARRDLERLLDPLPYAAVLLDARARILFANAAGEDTLSSRRRFRPAARGRPLRPTHRQASERFDTALAAILLDGAPDRRWIMAGPDGTHLAVHMRPVGPPAAAIGAVRLVVTLRAIGAALSGEAPAPLGS